MGRLLSYQAGISMANDEPYTPILSNTCAECKVCCHGDVPEGICAYNTVEEILKNSVPEELIRQLVVYRVAEGDIEAAANKWWHFPFETNLLTLLTLPEEGCYEFLAVPYAKDACIFLSEQGCICPPLKPFDCTQFPFYFRHGEFYKESWCDLTKTLDDHEMRLTAKRAVDEYVHFLQAHQKEYLKMVRQLKDRYKLKVLSFVR
jgi:hypothetical protein